jgi:transposase
VISEAREKLLKLLLMKKLKSSEARSHVHEFLEMISHLTQCPIEALKTLGKTLLSWSEEIVRMWRSTLSNAITEGFHNKMEMISRRAFGFRNFNNYRLRVIALCGWDGLSNRC